MCHSIYARTICSRRGQVPSPAQRGEAPQLSYSVSKRPGALRRLPRRGRLGLRDSCDHYLATPDATLNPANSRSIVSLTLPSANSAATRTAFLMAFVFDDPWVMMHTPFTPSRGAPPYSV